MRSIENRKTFKASLQRCIEKSAFLDDFYEAFQAASEEVRDKFKNTDFSNQKFILRASLYIMETAADSDQAVPALLDLAKVHDRQHYEIKPELYDIWLDCMISAVAKNDPEYSKAVEDAWRHTMGPGIDVMKAAY